MKRIIIHALILTAAQCVTAQIVFSPNRFSEQGQRHGQWTQFFDRDWKRVEKPVDAAYYRIITYENGKPKGITRDYYLSGVLQWEGAILLEEPEIVHGPVVYYHANGVKSSEGAKYYGIMDGSWKDWHEDGRLKSEGDYVLGELEGPWVFHDSLGGRAVGEYLNSRPHGAWIFHFPDGTIQRRGSYRYGLREGPWVIVEKDASWSEGRYESGKVHGCWKRFYAGGTPASLGDFVQGVKTGVWQYWHENGKVWARETYLHGVLNGNAVYFDEHGATTWEGTFSNGEPSHDFPPVDVQPFSSRTHEGGSREHAEVSLDVRTRACPVRMEAVSILVD